MRASSGAAGLGGGDGSRARGRLAQVFRPQQPMHAAGLAIRPTGLPEPGADSGGTGAPTRPRQIRLPRAALPSISPAGTYIAILAVLSASAAVVVSRHVFPHLSINSDEGIYLLHAQTLASGHLFPAAPDPADAFRPWLAAVDGNHYVLKYTPFVPALLAASLFLTGGVWAALALAVGAAVVLTYLLGKEIFADRRVAAVAATLFAASPLVIVQSGLVLGYLPVLVGVQVGMLGLLRGTRLRRPLPFVCAGFAVGCAAATRPFDVVLLLAPVAVWAFVGCRGRRWWATWWAAVGLAVPAAALLAYNNAATGSPTRLPFALLEPSDALGFGVRRLYPSDFPREFGPDEGLAGVGDHLWYLGSWGFAGVLLAGVAVAALVRRRVPAAGVALGAGAVSLVVGYIGFWGVWNAAQLWGGIRYLGPFYVLPLLLPLVLLGARGLADIAAALWRLWAGPVAAVRAAAASLAALAGLAALAAAGVSVVVLVGAVQANLAFTRHDADLARLLAAQPGRPVVFVGIDPPFLGHPVNLVSNPPRLDGRILYAVSNGAADVTVAARHPGRPLYLLRTPLAFNGAPQARATGMLERLEPVTGSLVRVRLTVDAAPAGFRAARVVVTAGGVHSSYPVDPERGATATLAVTRDGVLVTGLGSPSSVAEMAPSADRSVTVAFHASDGPGEGNEDRFVDRFVLPVAEPVADAGGFGISVLVPTEVVGAVGDGRQPSFQARLASAVPLS